MRSGMEGRTGKGFMNTQFELPRRSCDGDNLMCVLHSIVPGTCLLKDAAYLRVELNTSYRTVHIPNYRTFLANALTGEPSLPSRLRGTKLTTNSPPSS